MAKAKKEKYVIKQETLDNIKNAMKNVLSNYKGTTNYALDEIINEWIKAKQPLFDILSKHPNWNHEKLMIQFDADYSREFDRNAIYTFRDFIKENVLKREKVHFISYLPDDQYEAYAFIGNISTQFFEEDSHISARINNLNRYNDNFKLRTNMKASKAIGKICNVLNWNTFEDYNKQYAKLCDSLNPIKVVRHTCISLNPIDFLLMSNGNSWSSCHGIKYIKSQGCYCSGTLSYMLDPCSFVFYTVDGSFNGTDIELEPKLQRQIFGYKENVIFQSRLYPQDLDYGAAEIYKDIRNIVQKVISDCLELPNLWVILKDNITSHVRRGSNSTAYPDFKHSRGICTVTVHKTAMENKDKLKMVMMGRQPICLKCGNKHSNTNSLYCRSCGR